MAINCFEEEGIFSDGNQPVRAVPVQKFVIFLDLYNTTPLEYSRIKPPLLEFIHSLYGTNHQVMVAALMPTKKLGVICPFTADMTRVRILLGKATANPKRDVMMERKYDELFRVFESRERENEGEQFHHVAHEVETLANQERSESMFSLNALENFAGYLTNVNRRERIVMLLVSGGFSRDPGRRFYEVVDRLALRTLNNDPLKMMAFKRSNFDFENEVQKAVGKLSRSNVTIYTVDTRGPLRRKEYQDSLIEIADETGGLSFYNSLNFKEGFSRIIQDLNHQYVICYNPLPGSKSAAYHKIKVISRRSNVHLRYRNGYFN
jgi:VWFA-related protein